MRRRDFITILGGAAAAPVIRPSLVGAATSAKRRIIYIPYLFGSETGKTFTDAFVQGLQDLGYDLGRDLDLRFRDAGGDWDRYPALVKEEIVQLKPDVFYAFATVDAVAARKATSTIPIVCAALADAVRLGLIASDARPGGNVTGIAPYVAGLPAKYGHFRILPICVKTIDRACIRPVEDDRPTIDKPPKGSCGRVTWVWA
jgi:putative tryptophan/tyrosine transport system substrate-binding protein